MPGSDHGDRAVTVSPVAWIGLGRPLAACRALTRIVPQARTRAAAATPITSRTVTVTVTAGAAALAAQAECVGRPGRRQGWSLQVPPAARNESGTHLTAVAAHGFKPGRRLAATATECQRPESSCRPAGSGHTD